jgi:Cof subfamily protein (haloacid dehalogenase superfamily)
MNVKAICTDIDGTLLDSRRQLSTRTIAAIKAISNMPVILASSRMPSAMFHLQEELGITDHPLICYNGGYPLYYKENSLHLMQSVEINAQLISSIVKLAEGSTIHVSLYREDEWYAPCVDRWTEREETITKVRARIEPTEKVVGRWLNNGTGAHKVMCMGEEEEMNVFEKELQLKLSAHLHLYRSRPTYIEIAPVTTSKGSALKAMLHKVYGLAMDDVMAFGDNYNDADMIEAAGLGIAVANARSEIKTIAREITLPSTEDGVAIAIEKYCM